MIKNEQKDLIKIELTLLSACSFAIFKVSICFLISGLMTAGTGNADEDLL